MGMVLVRHEISGQTVEIDERHLAHPVLGPLYKVVKVNKPEVLAHPVSEEKAEVIKADAAAKTKETK